MTQHWWRIWPTPCAVSAAVECGLHYRCQTTRLPASGIYSPAAWKSQLVALVKNGGAGQPSRLLNIHRARANVAVGVVGAREKINEASFVMSESKIIAKRKGNVGRPANRVHFWQVKCSMWQSRLSSVSLFTVHHMYSSLQCSAHLYRESIYYKNNLEDSKM